LIESACCVAACWSTKPQYTGAFLLFTVVYVFRHHVAYYFYSCYIFYV